MPFRTDMPGSNLVGIGVDLTEVCNRHCHLLYDLYTTGCDAGLVSTHHQPGGRGGFHRAVRFLGGGRLFSNE